MPTYAKNPEAVSKLTPELYRVTQTDRTEHPLAIRRTSLGSGRLAQAQSVKPQGEIR